MEPGTGHATPSDATKDAGFGVNRPSHVKRAAIVLVLFAFGLTAGWVTRTPHPNNDPAEEKASPSPPGKEDVFRSAPPDEKPSMAQADEYFLDGRYARAQAMFQQLEAKDTKQTELKLRIALCEEENGAFDEAIKRYQQLIPAGTFVQAQIAHISQARVHLRRGNFAAAEALLWPFVLRGGHAGDPKMLSEASFLLALSLGLDSQPGIGVYRPTFPETLPWRTDRFLENSAPGKKKEPAPRIVLGPAEEKLDQIVLDGAISKGPAKEVMEQIANTAGVTIDWSPRAIAGLEGRHVSLHSANLSVLSMLQGLAGSLELCCVPDKAKVRIRLASEMEANDVALVRKELALRILTEAVTHNPKHVFAPTACLLLGNLYSPTRPEAALDCYDRVESNSLGAQEAIYAQFNKAVLSQNTGDYVSAKRAFFTVLDMAPGHPLVGEALLRLGCLGLEEGDYPKALTFLKRADAHRGGKATATLCALALALSHTLTDDAEKTRSVLKAHRLHLTTESHKAFATFLIAYSQYREETKPSNVIGQNLLRALLSLPDEGPLEGLGRYAIGLAYSDLGITDRACDAFEKLTRTEKGPLQQEAQLRLADCHATLGKSKEARLLYEGLSKGTSMAASWARYRLAVMEVEEDRPNPCIELCRRLLDEPSPVGRTRVLLTMGRAYERIGDLARAVRCYGGELPD